MRMTLVMLATLTSGIAAAQVTPSERTPSAEVPPPGQAQPRASKLAAIDQKFIEEAATTNLAQIKLGQLAVRRGTAAKVRELGQKMIDDHTKANDQLNKIATRTGIALPTEVTPEQKADYDRLSALSGDAFDQAYMDLVKTDQQQAISLFQDEAQSGVDPELKTLAKNTLPALRQHHQLASRPVRKM
jgi:putative membrane protein